MRRLNLALKTDESLSANKHTNRPRKARLSIGRACPRGRETLPALVLVILAHASAEETLAAVAAVRSVMLASRPVAADRARCAETDVSFSQVPFEITCNFVEARHVTPRHTATSHVCHGKPRVSVKLKCSRWYAGRFHRLSSRSRNNSWCATFGGMPWMQEQRRQNSKWFQMHIAVVSLNKVNSNV